MRSTAAALPATPSVFRAHVAPEWNSEARPSLGSTSVITRPGTPLSRSTVMLIEPRPDNADAPEPGPQTPLAYHFAEQIGDRVDPTTLPRMGTHNSTIVIVYYGNSYYWVYRYNPD